MPQTLSTGTGSEFRQPFGHAIVGGLFVSQALTLSTTLMVYIYMGKIVDLISHMRDARRKQTVAVG